MTHDDLEAFFARYARLFNQALAGDVDMDALASLYASEFIGSAPVGVMAGRNDHAFRQTLVQGYDHYRAIGTRAMQLRHVRVSPIDADHGLAHVGWRATYARKGGADGPDIAIDFEVHYLVREQDGALKVFGWISGDEEALLREHGIV